MPEISAKPRTELGKQVEALRRKGLLPAVLYGKNVPTTSLAIPARDFEKVLHEAGETSLVTLKVEGEKEYDVLIHDVAKDPMTLEPIHADFFAVEMDKPIEAKVPFAFTGESPAVKNEGGIIVKVLHELEVKALPRDLPHEIPVDVSRLEKIGDMVHVKDLVLPQGVVSHVPLEEVVILVEAPRAEEVAPPVAEEAAVAEVKTEREVKAAEKAAKADEEKAAEE